MRVGSREAGRDGVQTIKAQDDRIKYVALSPCHCFQVCTQISLHSVLCWKFLCSSNPSNVLLSCIFFPLRYDGLHHGSSYLEHTHFLAAVRAKGLQAPAVDLQDGLVSVAIGVAAQLSIERGRFITIEEVKGEF